MVASEKLGGITKQVVESTWENTDAPSVVRTVSIYKEAKFKEITTHLNVTGRRTFKSAKRMMSIEISSLA